MSSLPFVMQDPQRADLALSVVEGVIDTIPVYRLRFRKDASFWSVVQERTS